MEIAMTDEPVIRWVHEILKVGSVIKRNVKGINKAGKKYKTQWRWRCTFRDALYVCKLLWPYAQVKLHKLTVGDGYIMFEDLSSFPPRVILLPLFSARGGSNL